MKKLMVIDETNGLSEKGRRLKLLCSMYGINYFNSLDELIEYLGYKDKKKETKKFDPNESATQKQIAFLKKEGYNGSFDTLTKLEASQIIKEGIENQRSNY